MPPHPSSSAREAWQAAPDGGRIEFGLAGSGSLRWAAADITLVLEEARRRLDLSPIAAVALGRSLTAAALIQRISLKEPARIVFEVVGDGPLGKVIAEADDEGGLRGLVGEPQLAGPEDGSMKIASLVGRGMLRVTREDGRRRYTGQVALVSGELGDDVTHYLEQSEQIRSAVLLGVLPRPVGIAAAGGLIVEALPGTEEAVVDRLEGNIRGLEGVSAQLERGSLPGLVKSVLAGLELEVLGQRPLEYRCRCSRAALLERLLPIAQESAEDLLGTDGSCEALCAFCGARYLYSAAELTSTH